MGGCKDYFGIMKKAVLMAKGLITFTGLAVGAGFISAYYYLWNRRKETQLPPYTFYYQEVQDDYASANQTAKAISSRLHQKLQQQYASGQVQDCTISWDNPRWLVTPKQCRMAAGLLVDPTQKDDKTIKEALQSEQLKSVELKPSHAIMLDINIDRGSLKPMLMRLAWWFLSRRYYSQYLQRVQKAGETFTPLGQTRQVSHSYLFAPLPEDIQHFKFISLPEPELNPAGQHHKQAISARPPLPAESPTPKSK